ncbi:NAD-dependent epimerase/dehydratase family protein [Bacillus sp. FJAT-29790]|uniref:NAD-dependent epimerase/dehydratase family protein n=1 Tax=Bacillus sp. FJAT-29790 TaxID=1895002 RepID=UPI001C229479|nr:NAD-dependent epimerase/dehydratase family protein [Bacillus sp. FJAT-29790]MBU8878146.1 NAD-dependent epimerase/dehydratase family protein [Bacillus sp. FJAT-29790]
MERKRALIIGATGLVGTNLVNLLLKAPEYEKVIVWVRKPTGIKEEKLEEKIIDFEKIDSYTLDERVEHVFCCLGTTIKKAKTKEVFLKVDLDYPISIAKKAKEHNVSQFLVISAMGANKNSRIFYSSVKGQLEAKLKMLELRGLKIFRPSLLLGNREEFRLGEKAAEGMSKVLPFMFIGPIKKYKPISAFVVATAMYQEAILEQTGFKIFNSDQIQIKGNK